MDYIVRKIYQGYRPQSVTEHYLTLDEAKDVAEQWARASKSHIAYVKFGDKTIQYQIQEQLVILED